MKGHVELIQLTQPRFTTKAMGLTLLGHQCLQSTVSLARFNDRLLTDLGCRSGGDFNQTELKGQKLQSLERTSILHN